MLKNMSFLSIDFYAFFCGLERFWVDFGRPGPLQKMVKNQKNRFWSALGFPWSLRGGFGRVLGGFGKGFGNDFGLILGDLGWILGGPLNFLIRFFIDFLKLLVLIRE